MLLITQVLSIYFDDSHGTPINIPARLDTEKSCALQLWISDDLWLVTCVGIGSEGKYKILLNDHQQPWRLKNIDWNELVVSAWADKQSFQVDIQSLEIDRIVARL